MTKNISLFMTKKNILAICGSTRKSSTNHDLIKAIAALFQDSLNIILFDGLADLPHFNPDNDGDGVEDKVVRFRQQMVDAEGILICTPEYAYGIPGSLKNAIDWTVSSSGSPGKPTMLITASTDGSYGHRAMLDVLNAIEAKKVSRHQLIISFAKTKIGTNGKIKDEKTLDEKKKIMYEFLDTINRNNKIKGKQNSTEII